VTISFNPFEDDDEPRLTPTPQGRTEPPSEPQPDPAETDGSNSVPGPDVDDDDDEPRLGTSPTISKAEATGKASTPRQDRKVSTGAGSGGRKRSRPTLGLAVIVVAALVFAGIPVLRSAFARTPKDRIGISYGGGPIEGVHFQKVIPPGHGLFFNGFFDSLYLYPADQLNYILAPRPNKNGKGTTDDSVVAPTSDRVNVSYQVAVYYRLNTDRLRPFHEEFGLRYQAYTDSGWDRLVTDTLRQQIEAALQEETRRHTVAELFGDADLLVKVQNEIQGTITTRLEAAMGERFFCGPTFGPGGECGDPTFVIKRIDIPDAVAAAFESNRTSEVLITTRQNEVRQREEEARAIAAINDALQQNSRAYVMLKAIESGKINFWVLPEGSDVDLTAPDPTSQTPTDPGQ